LIIVSLLESYFSSVAFGALIAFVAIDAPGLLKVTAFIGLQASWAIERGFCHFCKVSIRAL